MASLTKLLKHNSRENDIRLKHIPKSRHRHHVHAHESDIRLKLIPNSRHRHHVDASNSAKNINVTAMWMPQIESQHRGMRQIHPKIKVLQPGGTYCKQGRHISTRGDLLQPREDLLQPGRTYCDHGGKLQ